MLIQKLKMQTTTNFCCLLGIALIISTNIITIRAYNNMTNSSVFTTRANSTNIVYNLSTTEVSGAWTTYDGDCNWALDLFSLIPVVEGKCSVVWWGLSMTFECNSSGAGIATWYNGTNCDGYAVSGDAGIYYCDAPNNGSDCDSLSFSATELDDSDRCEGDGITFQQIEVPGGFEDGVCINYYGIYGIEMTINETDGYSRIEYWDSDCSGTMIYNETIENKCVQHCNDSQLYQFGNAIVSYSYTDCDNGTDSDSNETDDGLNYKCINFGMCVVLVMCLALSVISW